MSKSSKSSGAHRVRVDGDRAGQRLDNFLSAQLKGVPKTVIYKMVRTGQARINGKRCKVSTRVAEGDEVRVPPARVRDKGEVTVPGGALQALQHAVIHEDENMIVVNKPSGMAVHSGSGLAWGLIDAMRLNHPDEYLELVHRLDRDTSGCLVLARNGRALVHLSTLFRNGQIRKSYLCLMNGRMERSIIDVDAPLLRVEAEGKRQVEVRSEGKAAVTRFTLIELLGDCSYAKAELFTGRTHQIRAHARHIGHPLAGDDRYSSRESSRAWRKRGLKRIFLHAHRLGFLNLSGEDVNFEAPLPEALESVLATL